jgi:hypothetical protein
MFGLSLKSMITIVIWVDPIIFSLPGRNPGGLAFGYPFGGVMSFVFSSYRGFIGF